MCMYVYVCMCMYVYVYVWVCICVCMYVCMYTYVSRHVLSDGRGKVYAARYMLYDVRCIQYAK